jgi:hypothetical protein
MLRLKRWTKIGKRDGVGMEENGPREQTRPTRRKIDYLKRLMAQAGVGSRVSYHLDSTETKLTTLVIGYEIDDYYLFLMRDIEFIEEGNIGKVVLHTNEGSVAMSHIHCVRLLVPGDSTTIDRKLDYQSRSGLGARGSLTPGSYLKLITNGGRGQQSLKVEVEVGRHTKLTVGPHKGMHVAVLDVKFGTLEEHETRKEVRIPCSMPAVITRDSDSSSLVATVLDYSDSAMRVLLDDTHADWPVAGSNALVTIEFQTSAERDPVQLQCRCTKARDGERVLRMEQIVRDGAAQPFTNVDSLEIKIDLMHCADRG